MRFFHSMRRAHKNLPPETSKKMDAGLLMLRAGLGLSMLALHGLPHFQQFCREDTGLAALFGVSGRVILLLTFMAEIGGSLLLILGWFTRAAALVLATVMAIAFGVIHGASFEGEQSGELAFLYLIGTLVLALTGPGRYACDSR